MKESLKEFLHFIRTGRARPETGSSIPTDEDLTKAEAEAKHAEFVRNVDAIIDSQPISNAPPPPPFITYEPKLDLPQHKPVYQLNEAQAERLRKSAAVGNVAWAIPQPRPGDDKELAEGLNQLNQEIADLQGLELVKDVSEHFKAKIANALKLHGRHTRYYAPTGYTFQLFTEWEWAREGDHDVRKERTVQ